MIDVRNRLAQALRETESLPALRERLVLVLSDLEEAQAAPTLRSEDLAPDTQPDSAPPVDSTHGYGLEYAP